MKRARPGRAAAGSRAANGDKRDRAAQARSRVTACYDALNNSPRCAAVLRARVVLRVGLPVRAPAHAPRSLSGHHRRRRTATAAARPGWEGRREGALLQCRVRYPGPVSPLYRARCSPRPIFRAISDLGMTAPPPDPACTSMSLSSREDERATGRATHMRPALALARHSACGGRRSPIERASGQRAHGGVRTSRAENARTRVLGHFHAFGFRAWPRLIADPTLRLAGRIPDAHVPAHQPATASDT
jgi:hypothetical protein